MSKLSILCYGDSNTWGYNPVNGRRFSEEIRWPGVLAQCLGERARVIEDGLNGRTLCSFYMEGDPLNGSEHLFSALAAQVELHILILYLGINDLFSSYQMTAQTLADELYQVVRKILGHYTVQLIILAPLPIYLSDSTTQIDREITESRRLSPLFKEIATQQGCLFFDPADVISASVVDGVHIDAENHVVLGKQLCTYIDTNC